MHHDLHGPRWRRAPGHRARHQRRFLLRSHLRLCRDGLSVAVSARDGGDHDLSHADDSRSFVAEQHGNRTAPTGRRWVGLDPKVQAYGGPERAAVEAPRLGETDAQRTWLRRCGRCGGHRWSGLGLGNRRLGGRRLCRRRRYGRRQRSLRQSRGRWLCVRRACRGLQLGVREARGRRRCCACGGGLVTR